MFRSLLQVYVSDSDEAFELYMKAFDAKVGYQDIAPDGTVIHRELVICEQQAMAVGDVHNIVSGEKAKAITGNTTQFCLQFGEGGEDKVIRAYETLIEGGKIITPLGGLFFSPCGAEIIDKYGVWWCLFV